MLISIYHKTWLVWTKKPCNPIHHKKAWKNSLCTTIHIEHNVNLYMPQDSHESIGLDEETLQSDSSQNGSLCSLM